MKKRIIIHPFLMALFPVLFLYAKNIRLLLPTVLIWPTIIILAIVGLSYFVLVSIFPRKKFQIALFMSLAILTIFSYGSFYGSVFYLLSKNTYFNIYLPQVSKVILAVYLVIVCLGTVLIIKGKRILSELTFVANRITLFLVLYSLLQIVFYDINLLSVSDKKIDRENISDEIFIISSLTDMQI